MKKALHPGMVRTLIAYWFISLATRAVYGEFKFLKPLTIFKNVESGDNVDFDCNTNEESASTSLWKIINGITWEEMKLKPGRLIKKGNVFTLLNANTNDGHPYKCKAVKAGKTITSSRQMNLFVKPRANPSYTHWPKQPVFRHIGHSAVFYLNATKRVEITWSRTDEKDHSKHRPITAKHTVTNITGSYGITSSKLTLYNLRLNDTGIYTAFATYRRTEKKEYFRLQVFGPSKPKIYGISPVLTVDELSSKEFECNVSAYPPADIIWYKSGQPVKVCHNGPKSKCRRAPYLYTVDSKSNWTVAFLKIQKVTFEDRGNYLCRANNTHGEIFGTTKLFVRTKPVIRKRTNIKNFRFGKSAILECEVERAFPLPTFQWFFQVSRCREEGVDSQCKAQDNGWQELPQQYFVPPKNKTGQKSRVRLPGGVPRTPTFYKCQAKNLRGSDFFTYEVLRFRQNNNMKILEVLPNKNLLVNAEDSVQLQCFLKKGILNHRNLGWYKNGKRLDISKSTRMSVIGADLNTSTVLGDGEQKQIILEIKNATIEDTGNYACRASQEMNKTVKVTVKALNPPKLFWQGEAAKGITIYESKTKSIILRCTLKIGNPKPEFFWFRNNRSLLLNTNHLSSANCQHAKDGTYFFTSGSKQDVILCGDPLKFEKFSGRYTCLAKNKLGVDKIHTDITILAAAEIQEPTGKHSKLFATLEHSVEQICRARGNPPPVLEWRKIQGSTSILVNNRTENGSVKLFIESFTEEDQGNYSCVARNGHSVQQSFLQLKLDPVTFASEKKAEGSTTIIGPVMGCVFGVLILALIACFVWQKKKQRNDKYYLGTERHYDIDPDRTILEQVNDMPYDPDWEFREDRLLLGAVLGSGAFGQVMKAEAMGILSFSARDKTDQAFKRRTKLRRSIKSKQMEQRSGSWKFAKTTVAVKTLKENAGESEYRDLASEIKIMIHIGEHPNIINILGACTRSKKLMLIMEYAPHGSLLKFLREKRAIYQPTWHKSINDPNVEYTLVDLLMASYQIARGMEFLASKKCIHRDLAARNVLIGEGHVMKIADFGLARDVYKNDEYVKQTTGLLPVKWMALESLFDRVYTEKSDVWSFGIVLWEIFTLGGTPYPGLPTEHLLDFLSENKRMSQPHDCPPKIYTMMRDCWIMQPECRPTFAVLAEQLGKFLEKNIKKDNPYISLALEETPTGNHYYLCPKESGSTTPKPYSQDGAGPSGYNPNDAERKEKYFSDCSAATSNIPSDAMDSISVRTSHLGPDPPPSYDEALRRSSDALESLTQSMAEEEVKAAAAWVAGYGSSGSADEGIGLEEEALEKKKLLSSPVDDSETTRYHNSEEMRILVQPTPTKSGRRQRIESVV